MANWSYKNKYKSKKKKYNSKIHTPSEKNVEMAEKISLLLLQKGFAKKEMAKSIEIVYFKSFGAAEINVYTTIIKSNGKLVSRKNGSDAIRVCAVIPKKGFSRPLFAEKRVNRTSVESTIERLSERIDDCESKIGSYIDKKCKKCNALLYTSKSGKHVCSDLCFTYVIVDGIKHCSSCNAKMTFGYKGYYCRPCFDLSKSKKNNKVKYIKWK